MRIIFMGIQGAYSLAVFRFLLMAGTEVAAACVPGRRQKGKEPQLLPAAALPIANNLITLAQQQNIPVYELYDPAAAHALFHTFQPDLVCVACFPWRIPPILLNLPSYGFLNVHPSMLPAHRGPYPLFWTFRLGEQTTGVTIHFMDEGWDSGDIALQQTVILPDGISGSEADRLCARVGGDLLVEAIQQLKDGRLVRRSQIGGTYEGVPGAAAFQLDTNWSARHAYNFMCGTVEWQYPYFLLHHEQRITLQRAVSFAEEGELERPLVWSGHEVAVQFTPGILYATPLPNHFPAANR